MKLTTLTIILLVIISSCTIEKRLYNRGWNVQWRKYHQVSNQKELITEKSTIEFTGERNSTSSEEPTFVGNTQEIEQIIMQDEVLEDNFISNSPNVYQEPEDTTKKSVKTPSPYADMSTSRERNARNTRMAFPVTYIVLGVIAIILAIVIYFSLSSMADALVALFSVLAMLGLGIIGLMLILMGLVVLFATLNR